MHASSSCSTRNDGDTDSPPCRLEDLAITRRGLPAPRPTRLLPRTRATMRRVLVQKASRIVAAILAAHASACVIVHTHGEAPRAGGDGGAQTVPPIAREAGFATAADGTRIY